MCTDMPSSSKSGSYYSSAIFSIYTENGKDLVLRYPVMHATHRLLVSWRFPYRGFSSLNRYPHRQESIVSACMVKSTKNKSGIVVFFYPGSSLTVTWLHQQ